MKSPSRTSAIGPPSAASGLTCPMHAPRVAPEKRPSVSSATDSPSPMPMITDVGAEHLLHARPAARALVADDHDVAGLHLALGDARHGLLLAVEEHRGAAVPVHGRDHAGRLHHRAFGSQVAEQHREPALLAVRVRQRADDLLVLDRGVPMLRAQRARDGGPVQVERARLLGQRLEDRGHAARAVHVVHVPRPGGGDLAQVRHAVGDLVDARQRVVDPRLARDGQRVQHRVGRSAHGHVERERVVDGLAGDDLRGVRSSAMRCRIRPAAAWASASRCALRACAEPL